MTEASSTKRRRVATGLGIAAAALLIAFSGGVMMPSDWMTPTQSASFFPALALMGVTGCGVAIALGASTDAGAGPAAPVNWRAIAIGVVVAAYAIVLPFLGLIVSTLVLSVGLPALLGYRNWAAIGVLTLIIIALTWLVFIEAMGVPLKLVRESSWAMI